MTWTVLDLRHNQNYEFKEFKIIAVGNYEECEIKISNTLNSAVKPRHDKFKSKSIHSQIIFDDGFIFHIHNDIVSVHFLKASLKFENDSFLFEYNDTSPREQGPRSPYHFQDKCKDIANICDIFSSEEFLNLLSNVQQSFFKFHKFNIEMQKISITELIQHAAGILAAQFFNSTSVFDDSLRKKFYQIIWCVWAQIFEYGVLTPAILNSKISEVMVNGYKNVYFEEHGKIVPANISFSTENELSSLIERICASMGRRIDESMPYCDARLKEGHRVHAIIPPLSLIGPCLTIRKFPNFSYNMEKLIEQNSLSKESAALLEAAIVNKKNIVISGGTGSGKTTLLNCLSVFIPHNERILTIEDSAELQMQQPHVVRLECRKENIEKQGEVTIRDLVRNALRMRPNRIIVGECRGSEALDMLQAMNTGHDGSMTTVHANSPQDALRRLETLVLFSEVDLPSRAIREQLASAIHFIVQQTRLPSGKRCVTSIEKIIGFDEKTTSIMTESIYEL